MNSLVEKSKNDIFFWVLILIYLEYANSLLRYFGLIDMAVGVTIRKGIFIIIFFFVILLIASDYYKHRTISISKRLTSIIVMYMFFGGRYLVDLHEINITDISNMMMPLVVGIIAWKTGLNKDEKKIEHYLLVYFATMFLLYLTNVYKGAYQYSSVGLNSIYYIILVLPLVYLIKNSFIRYILIVSNLLLGIISLKATAIALVFGILVVKYCIEKKKFMIRVVTLPVVALFLFLILFYVADTYFSIDIFDYYVRQNSLDGGNGRLVIWENVMSLFEEGTFFTKLFGNGYDAVAKALEWSAHNEFIEVLFDFGLLGLIFFVYSFFKLSKIGIKMYGMSYRYANIYIMLLFEMLVMFLLSNMVFVASYVLIVVFFLIAFVKDFYYGRNVYEDYDGSRI